MKRTILAAAVPLALLAGAAVAGPAEPVKDCLVSFHDPAYRDHGIALFNFDCDRSSDIYAAISGEVHFRPSKPGNYRRTHEFEIRGLLDGKPALVLYRFWNKNTDLADSMSIKDGATVTQGQAIGRFAPAYINDGDYLYLFIAGAAVNDRSRDWFD